MKRRIYATLLIVAMLIAMLVSGCGAKQESGENAEHGSESIGAEMTTETERMTESESATEVMTEPEVKPKNESQPEKEPETQVQVAPPAPVVMESWASGYYVYDPYNTRGLSNVRYGYAYGVAANEQRPVDSINMQGYFDGLGFLDALSIDLKSTEKVLYLTFSCGYEYNNNTMKILDTLKEKGVTAAFFGELGYFKKNPHLTKRFIEEGHILGNHTATHPDFPTLTRDQMASEIYRVDKFLKDNYGYECRYFRFPGGYYSENALELVASVGHRCVFWSVAYRDWDRNEQQGGDYSFDTITSRLHPGAVIVLHTVSNDNVEALGAIIDYAREKGYTFQSLDAYPWD